VYTYTYLLVDEYPPFAWHAPNHPVQITLNPGRLNRAAVFFRIILAIPAIIIADVITAGWAVLAFFFWLTVLVLGRVPAAIFGATAAIARYEFRFQAYFLMLTSAYPKRLFGDQPVGARMSDTRPLVLTQGARVLLVVLIILGIFGEFGEGVNNARSDNQQPGVVAGR
jgi:hypothetical protein